MPGEGGDMTVHIPLDPEMTGPEPGVTTTIEPVGKPTPAPVKAAPEAASADGEEGGETVEPAAEEWEVETPGGKITAKELTELRATHARAAELETRERAFEARQRELDTAKQERERAQAEAAKGPPAIDPFDQSDLWRQTLFRQLANAERAAGREVDEERIADRVEREWLNAKVNVQNESLKTQRQELAAERQQIQVERERQWLHTTIDRELAIEGRQVINTPEGRDDVNAHLAATLNRTGQITEADIQAAVKKVAARANDIVSAYVNKKQGQSNATRGITRGGGAQRAPGGKKYEPTLAAFGQIANDIERGGG